MYHKRKYLEKNNPKSMKELELFFQQTYEIQEKQFGVISKHCAQLQGYISVLETTITQLNEKTNFLVQIKENQSIKTLKNNQFQFIVSELEQQIAKHVSKENQYTKELNKMKKQILVFKDQLKKKDLINKQKIFQLHKLQNQKYNQNKQLLLSNEKILSLQKKIIQLEKNYQLKKKNIKDKDQFDQLDEKLKDLQKQFLYELELQRNKHQQTKKKFQLVVKDKNKLQCMMKNNQQKQIQNYELQLRYKQTLQSQTELQVQYSNLLDKSNQSEISLHQQIQRLKGIVNQQKKQSRNYLKVVAEAVQNLARYFNQGKNYYMQSKKLPEQLDELKKVIQNNIHKQVKQIKEKTDDARKKIEEELKLSQTKLYKIEKAQGNQTNILEKKNDKQQDKNGSLISDKSQAQQKYKNKIDSLRNQLKRKQTIINQLEIIQHEQFEKSKEKILSLQTQLSQKNNQSRRFKAHLQQKIQELHQTKQKLQILQQKHKIQIEQLINKKVSIINQLEEKYAKQHQKLRGMKQKIRDLEKKEQQKTYKYNKLKSIMEKLEEQKNQSLKRRNLQVQELIKKNQTLKIDMKILTEKINIQQINENFCQLQNQQASENKKIINKVQQEKEKILDDFEAKSKQLLNLKISYNNLKKDKQIISDELKQEKKLKSQYLAEKLQIMKDCDEIKEQGRVTMQKNDEKKDEKINDLKKRNQKLVYDLGVRQKSLEKRKKQTERNCKSKEKYKEQVHLNSDNVEKWKKKINVLEQEINQLKNKHLETVKQYEQKITELKIKENQLINIINYKNRQNGQIRESMQCDYDELGQNQVKQQISQDYGMNTVDIKCFDYNQNTEKIQVQEFGINTDAFLINKFVSEPKKNQMILGQIFQLQKQEEFKKDNKNTFQENIKSSNLFLNLQMGDHNIEDNFEICEEGQSINVGQTEFNLQIKQIFNYLRLQIQKIFNQQDVSMQFLKILPRQLEDDYNQFITYLKEKMLEIKSNQHLSFIMVEAGEELSNVQNDLSLTLKQFVNLNPLDDIKRQLEEKDSMIISLMNDKTEQENTINQLAQEKQQLQEENQNRFMNQCNVYKRQVKQLKKFLDVLEMNFQSLRNIFKNLLEIWADDTDNQEDLKDNLTLYTKIAKLTDKQKNRLNYFICRYKKQKGIE